MTTYKLTTSAVAQWVGRVWLNLRFDSKCSSQAPKKMTTQPNSIYEKIMMIQIFISK
jgi:hypothetical protein